MKQHFRQKKRARATIPGTCARTLVSCLRSAHARGAVREPREVIIDDCYRLGRALFSYLFSASLFSHKIVIFNENGLQNGPQIGLFWELFSEKERKQKSAFRLHRRVRIACEPSSWNAKGNAKSFKKARRIPGPFFSRKHLKNYEN